MKKSILLLVALALSACAQPALISSDRETVSPIALCGGVLGERITAAVEATYRNYSAGATTNVVHEIEGILRDNQVSEEKYNAYLKCVGEVHTGIVDLRKRREAAKTCNAGCEAEKASCDIESKKMFDLCIARELKGCISDCKQYVRDYGLWHVNDCHTKYCNWNEMEDDTRALHIDRCNRRESYLEQVADCGADYHRCKASCPPIP